MSTQGDFIRAQFNTVTTFNQCLEVIADAFDGATADDAAAPANGDDDTSDDGNAEPAMRSRSPAPQKKKVVKRKVRRRYY